MYGHPRFERKHLDCPMCGKKEGSFMSASRWSHNFACCSDKCGEDLGVLIDKNVNSNKYKQMYKKYLKIKEQLDNLENKLGRIAKTSFKSNVEEFNLNGTKVRIPNNTDKFKYLYFDSNEL